MKIFYANPDGISLYTGAVIGGPLKEFPAGSVPFVRASPNLAGMVSVNQVGPLAQWLIQATGNVLGPAWVALDLAVASGGTLHSVTFTASGTWTVPDGVNVATFALTGGGGGGGGGGSAASTSTTANQSGGGGGGAGGVIRRTLAVIPADVLTNTVGAGGSGSAGGAASASGNGSSGGGNGGYTQVTGTGVNLFALGAGGGLGSSANNNSTSWGGLPAVIGSGPGVITANQGNFPVSGQGGLSNTGQPYNGFSPPLAGVHGGGGGGPASASLGGAGGGVSDGSNVALGGATGGSSTASGTDGATATLPGFGGAGGGGGATGGAGGAGGNGADGLIVIEWVA